MPRFKSRSEAKFFRLGNRRMRRAYYRSARPHSPVLSVIGALILAAVVLLGLLGLLIG